MSTIDILISEVLKSRTRVFVNNEEGFGFLGTLRNGVIYFDDGDIEDYYPSIFIVPSRYNIKYDKPIKIKDAKKYHIEDNGAILFKDRFEFIKYWFKFYNKKYFKNKLSTPKFKEITRLNTAKKGYYNHYRNEIGLYFDEVDSIKDTLYHEMCHQAVDEIDKVKFKKNTSKWFHGEEWQKWMKLGGRKIPSMYLNKRIRLINFKTYLNPDNIKVIYIEKRSGYYIFYNTKDKLVYQIKKSSYFSKASDKDQIPLEKAKQLVLKSLQRSL